jgi:hypothetical protein
VKSLLNIILDGSKDLRKQMRPCETRFKQLQNVTRLSSKLTPRRKRNKTREKHKRGEHLQRKNNLA